MPDEIVQNRINELSSEYRAFIESDFIEEAATSFGEASGFNGRRAEILENALTFYLIFLMGEAATIGFISRNCDLPESEASLLFSGIVASLPEGMNDMVRAQFLLAEQVSEAGLATEIAQTERDFENLQGIRTMATDMREAQTHQVPTYQSSQSDIIQSTTPTPPPQNGPRWETDK